MRFILAGLLLLLIPTLLPAQPTGQVQSIGFNGAFRPNCWTPMVVRLTPDSTDSANYEIAVYQHDLDGDRPIYTRPIVLNGSGQAAAQRFWIYFLPQPIEKGLPDLTTGSLRDLQRDLQVFLCKPGNPPKPIVELPLTSQLQNVDPYRDNWGSKQRSQKLILAVSSKGAQPTLKSTDTTVYGTLEDVRIVPIRPEDLPEDPIGYEAVDAVIWLDGNPADLAGNNLDSFAALKDYVRFGGNLVVCQSAANWQENQSFGDLLPVDVTGISTKSNFEPLQSMAHPRGNERDMDPFRTAIASWSRSQGPYQMARATARPGAVVDQWIDWKQDKSNTDATPYLARKAYGLGQVTWVAQQLTTESAPVNATAWPYIWDQVFGWKNNTYVLSPNDSEDDGRIELRLKQLKPGGPVDLGNPLTKGLDLTSRANWLILLAIFFFVVYWLVAGPGSYLYLAMKKRQSLSWFIFGIAALAATGVTVLVVKLVLRGPPEVRHITFVRVAPGQPALVHSRFGLYIPRDGDQKIALSGTSPTSVSYLAPFAIHPQQLGGDVTEFPSPTDYYVPVRDLKSDTPPELTVAYRSSAKKFQSRWVGDWTNRIAGSVQLNPDDHFLHISGTLTNGTGVDLSDVYLAFSGADGRDYMIYVPNWSKDTSYDIARDFTKPAFVGKSNGTAEAAPGDKKIICGPIANPSYTTDTKSFNSWQNLWQNHFRHSGNSDNPNIDETDTNYFFPLMTVFDRVPAMVNATNPNVYGKNEIGDDRIEFYNRGARILNASSSIAAGQLVIIATARGPVPVPLSVDDDKMQGEGTVFYQFILPIDRGKLDLPTTHPAGK
jgi:hypothetical protein